MEKWKWVRGFKHQYRISTHGRLWCEGFKYRVQSRGGWRTIIRKKGFVKSKLHDGYPFVCIGNGKQTARGVKIHTLVLEAFVGPCPPGKECCHKDDDRANNHLHNLRWGTRKSNNHDAVRNDRGISVTRGEHNTHAKLTEKEVKQVRKLRTQGWMLKRLARRFGVDRRTIGLIVKRETWRHI